jgi:hypothetical protein
LTHNGILNKFIFPLTQAATLCILNVFNNSIGSYEGAFMKDIIVISYLIYICISVVLTIWVARTLHKRGAIFLVDAFQGNAELAASVNHLLVVGFYLINIGFVSLALKTSDVISTPRGGIEMLSDKLGVVLLTLGGMHFFNLFVFARIRSHGQGHTPRRPPVAADATLKIAVPR